jgi:hypothetical protein
VANAHRVGCSRNCGTTGRVTLGWLLAWLVLLTLVSVEERVRGHRAGGVSAYCWVLRQHPLGGVSGPGPAVIQTASVLCWGRWVEVGGLAGLVFENCIVDASI